MSLETSQTGDKPELSLLGEGRWERVDTTTPAQRSGGSAWTAVWKASQGNPGRTPAMWR